eukprot:6111371-Prymnesium_polylepis.1
MQHIQGCALRGKKPLRHRRVDCAQHAPGGGRANECGRLLAYPPPCAAGPPVACGGHATEDGQPRTHNHWCSGRGNGGGSRPFRHATDDARYGGQCARQCGRWCVLGGLRHLRPSGQKRAKVW